MAKSKKAVVGMLNEARMGRAISKDAAAEVVEDIAGSVWRNPSALISLARLKTRDDYTYMHSVAVCAMMVALGKQLGLSEAAAARGRRGRAAARCRQDADAAGGAEQTRCAHRCRV